MVTKVENYITDNNLFSKKDKLVLGLSGGRDSVVLLHVLLKLGYQVVVAHCNFNLRGKESDNETSFVQNLCKQRNVKCHVKHFDTLKEKDRRGSSTQLVARELRYSWFGRLKSIEKQDKIVTAHQLDDQVETFFINLSRGTGLKGLLGIPTKVGDIARPLLSVSREEVTQYAIDNRLEYKDDSSNKSDLYLRNDIRHHVIPKFTSLNPSFLDSFNRTITHLDRVQKHWEKSYERWLIDYTGKDDTRFILEEVVRMGNDSFLTHYLHEKGFSHAVLEDLLSEKKLRKSGAVFYSINYQLQYNRGEWILSSKTNGSDKVKYFLKELNLPISLIVKDKPYIKTMMIPNGNNVVWINKNKIEGALFIRHWEQGDTFFPLGMSQKKKMSDYFIDNKFSRRDKEKIWLLCDEKSIIWIVGSRLDNRYRVTDECIAILEIEANFNR